MTDGPHCTATSPGSAPPISLALFSAPGNRIPFLLHPKGGRASLGPEGGTDRPEGQRSAWGRQDRTLSARAPRVSLPPPPGLHAALQMPQVLTDGRKLVPAKRISGELINPHQRRGERRSEGRAGGADGNGGGAEGCCSAETRPITLSPGPLFCLWGTCGQGDSDEQTAGFYVSLHVRPSRALSTNESPSRSSIKAQLGPPLPPRSLPRSFQ